MNILVCCNDTEIKAIIHDTLRSSSIEDTSTGEEAVEHYYSAAVNDARFDLIFVDAELPTMSGNETIKIIRDVEKRMRVPISDEVHIILITEQTHSSEEVEAYITGIADKYIEKPITPFIIRNEVNSIFHGIEA